MSRSASQSCLAAVSKLVRNVPCVNSLEMSPAYRPERGNDSAGNPGVFLIGSLERGISDDDNEADSIGDGGIFGSICAKGLAESPKRLSASCLQRSSRDGRFVTLLYRGEAFDRRCSRRR